MKNKAPIVVFVLAGSICGKTAAAAGLFPSPATAQPDIVVVMTDDLDTQMLDDAVSRGLMPNLKTRIIDRGATFSDYFVTDSVCGPSRSTLLTGQYPHNHGVLANEPPLGGASKLDDSSTLATWLTAAGYRTSLVGKYINGYGEDVPGTYVPPGWADWHVIIESKVDRYDFNENGVVTPMGFRDEEYPTDVLAERAESFINTTTGPYFLYITSLAPHVEYWTPTCEANNGPALSPVPATRHVGLAAEFPLPQGPAFNEHDIRDKPASWVAEYPPMMGVNIECMTTVYRAGLESLMAVDDLIGRVFAATDARGTTANTIFVFSSDNGFLYGQHRGREKGSIYEETVRCPFYVAGPGIAVQTVSAPVLNNDFAPTISEWAGASPSIVVDGRSFVPLLAGSAPWRTRFMVEHHTSGWFMIRADTRGTSRVRGRLVKYARHDATSEELYDLILDPAEMQSRHADPGYVGQRNHLRGQLKLLKDCTGAACMTIEDTP